MKDCAQLYFSMVNSGKNLSRSGRRSSSDDLLAQNERFRSDKPSAMGLGSSVPLSVCLGTAWISRVVKRYFFFTSVVSREFPAPLSHFIYPHFWGSHWPFLILWLPGLALRHRVLHITCLENNKSGLCLYTFSLHGGRVQTNTFILLRQIARAIVLQYLRDQLDGELGAESNLIVRPHLLNSFSPFLVSEIL